MNYEWKINKKQREFLNSSANEVLFSGGARSGKSVAICLKAVNEVAGKPGSVVILARKWFSTLRSSTLVTLLDGTAPYPPVLPVGTYEHNRTEHTIKLYGGGTIRYLGVADDIQKIRSMAASLVLIDEATEFSEEEWIELSLRICLPGSQQIMGATNPSSQHHWLYNRFVNNKTERTHYISTNALDNRDNLPKRTIDNLEALKGSMRERMLEGKWVATEKFIYADLNDNIIDVEKLPNRSLIKRWYLGVDYGYTNATAFTLIGRDGEDCYYAYDSYERSGMLIDDIVKYINDVKKYDPTIIIDPSAAGLIATIQSKGYKSVLKADNSVNLGIDRVRDTMARGRFKIGANCKTLITSMRNYMYGDDHKPIKVGDHGCDSCRYVLSTIQSQEEEVIAEKNNSPKMFFSVA